MATACPHCGAPPYGATTIGAMVDGAARAHDEHAVRLLLDGLGVASLAELRAVVDDHQAGRFDRFDDDEAMLVRYGLVMATLSFAGAFGGNPFSRVALRQASLAAAALTREIGDRPGVRAGSAERNAEIILAIGSGSDQAGHALVAMARERS